MCTVSWLHANGGYQVFCNRDEKRTRKAAIAPRVLSRAGVRYIAPSDGDYGGTWVFANECGVSACLLNGRGDYRGTVSRGLLLSDLTDSVSAAQLIRRVRDADLARFAPFTIAAFERGCAPRVIEWDGRRRVEAIARSPLTSSSFAPEEIIPRRIAEFERARPATGPAFAAVHASHGDGPGPQSICMHRADAETVSYSAIRVDGWGVSFTYSGDAPCRRVAGPTVGLALAA